MLPGLRLSQCITWFSVFYFPREHSGSLRRGSALIFVLTTRILKDAVILLDSPHPEERLGVHSQWGVMNHGASVLPLPLLPALCSHLQPNCGAECHTLCLCLLCSFPCWFESRCHCPGLLSRVDRHVPCPTAEQQHCSLYGISFCWVSAVLAAREQGWDLLIQGTRSPAVLMILMCKGEDRRSGTVLRVMLPALPGGCKMSHCPSV